MTKYKEAWDLAISVIKWGSAVIGGTCLLAHVMSTGEFLEDVSLGEGLVLYILSAVCFIAHAIYWAGITAVGLWLLRWPMQRSNVVAQRFAWRMPRVLPVDYSVMWAPAVWIAAATMTVLTVWLFRSYPRELLKYRESPCFRGLWVASCSLFGAAKDLRV
jgi:hypothetical protein